MFHGVTFSYDDLDEWAAVGRGEKAGHIYSRNTNPTTAEFESRIRLLEADPRDGFGQFKAAVANPFREPGRTREQ